MVWPGKDATSAAPVRRDGVRPASIEEIVLTGSKPVTVRMRLLGAHPSPSMLGDGELPGKVNYFIGNDPSRWRTNIPTFTHVRSGQVYPGIDLVYYGNQSDLEYDFVVAPRADPSVIRLVFEGAEGVEVSAAGELLVRTREGELRWRPPRVYQEFEGSRHEVAGAYRVISPAGSAAAGGRREVTFEVADYDTSRPLVIDPVLEFATYLGGTGIDRAYGAAVGSQGSVYITGFTRSLDFPVTNAIQATFVGTQYAFVTRLSSAGDRIIYSTYLGGGADSAHSIAVDGSGNAYVAGSTASTNFPTANAIQPTSGGGGDAFVTKLSPGGAALVFSTYLGGSGADYAEGIALDGATNIYVTGETRSGDFPTTNAFQAYFTGGLNDAFVAKLDASGAYLVYSTFLGGSDDDAGFGIALGSAGNAYIVGTTSSSDFPTQNPIQQAPSDISFSYAAFVAEFSADGSQLEYSTYLDAGASAIAVDAQGSAYVTGITGGANVLPITAGAFQPTLAGVENAFVAKFNPAGSAFDYLTYLGGTNNDSGSGIAVDADGNAYVAGYASSLNFPTLNALQAWNNGGAHDAFVTKLNPDGSGLLWSTFYGGAGDDQASAIALDSSGGVYVVGATSSSDFPAQGAVQPAVGGGSWDAFVMRIMQPAPLPALRIARSGASVVLSWPVAAAGFSLEAADTLAPTPSWFPATNTPAIVGSQNLVTLQADAAMKYFRLIKP
jgi:hypothetical protein